MKRLIVLRMVHPSADGNWMEVEAMRQPYFMQLGYDRTELAATGDIEWDGDVPGEVFVPKHLLNEWRRNHAIEVSSE